MATLEEILKSDSASNVVKLAALKPEVSQRTREYSSEDIRNPRTPKPSDLKAMGIYKNVSDVQASAQPSQPVGKMIMSNAAPAGPVTPNVTPQVPPTPHTVQTTTTTQHFGPSPTQPQSVSPPVHNAQSHPGGNQLINNFLGGNRDTSTAPAQPVAEPVIAPTPQAGKAPGMASKATNFYNNMSSGQKGFAAGVAALPVAYGAYQVGKKLMSNGKQTPKSDESNQKVASLRAEDLISEVFSEYKEASFRELAKIWENGIMEVLKGES